MVLVCMHDLQRMLWKKFSCDKSETLVEVKSHFRSMTLPLKLETVWMFAVAFREINASLKC